jgi:hypothetical protein
MLMTTPTVSIPGQRRQTLPRPGNGRYYTAADIGRPETVLVAAAIAIDWLQEYEGDDPALLRWQRDLTKGLDHAAFASILNAMLEAERPKKVARCEETSAEEILDGVPGEEWIGRALTCGRHSTPVNPAIEFLVEPGPEVIKGFRPPEFVCIVHLYTRRNGIPMGYGAGNRWKMNRGYLDRKPEVERTLRALLGVPA